MLLILAIWYQQILKRCFFLIDPEVIHTRMTHIGVLCGKQRSTRKLLSAIFMTKNDMLAQTIHRIPFPNPIGLAAGFDFDAQLTKVIPNIGFGFETVGTITNHPYKGNPPPIMGRLPKSQSLMVYKGFKNSGANAVIDRLSGENFQIPIGISIGRTNSPKLTDEKKSIADIVEAFQKFEKAALNNAYYELNISCPNLIYGADVSFYTPAHLEMLLVAVEKLTLKKPVFIKMPIDQSNDAVIAMLDVILKHKIAGIIIGNLQKNRTDPALDKGEVSKFPVGNFSGKPTWNRSNELIALAYKHVGDRLTIIGCGGVFSPEDAYEKILLGASLVQLITGMIYKGPQLIAQINNELPDLLQRDNFASITDAIGRKHLIE